MMISPPLSYEFPGFENPNTPSILKQLQQGSGFIIASDGTIVTNNHVVENARKIQIFFKDGQVFDARLLGMDSNTDLAAIKIDPESELSAYYGVWYGQGVLITEVFPGDPAEKAGLRSRDVITELNGKSIISARDLTQRIADISAGQTAQITALRQSRQPKFDVKIAKRPEEPQTANSKKVKPEIGEMGFKVSEMTNSICQCLALKSCNGVLVVKVQPMSPADKGGLEEGDIIREINHHPVNNLADYIRILDSFQDSDQIALFVQRMNEGFMVIELNN